ncbi:MAG: RHS repeat-associated core domain-containing protein [Steroidobacteraceae bacterium]
MTSMTTPSGQALAYSYNSNNQLTGVSLNGATLISNVTYEPFGPVAGWTWSNGTLAVRGYDLDGRLNLIDSAGLSTYGFDEAGQIRTRLDDTPAPYMLPAGITTVAVDSASNRITSTTGTLARAHSYDAVGNTTTLGGVTLAYNYANRLKSATQSGVTTNYTFNALGQRIRKSAASGTTVFVYDEAGHLLGEYTSTGGLIQETLWVGDIPIATLRPKAGGGVDVFYVHTDHLNTPRRVTRPSDNMIVWRWDSDPFGNAPANADPDGDSAQFAYPLRFPGQYFDAESGLHYNYSRNYDPQTNRYVESDPIGQRGGINTYIYALANPISYVDSFGLFCTKDFVSHYYFGSGPIDLGSVGLQNQFKNSASVQSAVSQFNGLLRSGGKARAAKACAGRTSGARLTRLC